MGAGLSITSITFENNIGDPRDKTYYVTFSDRRYNQYITFSEDWKYNYFLATNEIKPKFCLLPNMPIEHCGTFLTPKIADQYVLINGEPCNSFKFRPGSLIKYKDTLTPELINKLKANNYIDYGRRCHFVKKDYLIGTSSEIAKCCLKKDSNCPKRFSDYENEHCDNFMSKFCSLDPGYPNCLEWLRTKRKIALSTYSKICSKHMDERYCSEFIRVIRPDYFTFGDTALLVFCDNHKGNSNCWCVNHPNEESSDKYLGPRVCLSHECTDESRDRKWLYYNQDVQRTRCKYVGCSINVNSLTLNNSHADIISDCTRHTSVVGDVDPGKPVTKNEPRLPSWIGIVASVVILSVIFYFISIYSRPIVKTKHINVRRR
ncbi:myristylprotein [Murmansk poxvirus]|uniref:Myristylprotein n=1 Tax=Murmansk poxvirus TaxID=2025359 RepID=A0A223FMY0_9POXV|nr:myristylprotein [Murmansk poxvirus]AST09327.1 myristylprotein [Murmansk poxvirus]